MPVWRTQAFPVAVVVGAFALVATAASEPCPCAPPAADRLVDLRPALGDKWSSGEDWPGSAEVLHPVAGFGGGRALLGTFRIGAVFLGRDGVHEQPSAKILRAADEAVLVDMRDLDFGSRAGLDFTFAVALNSALDLHLRYFGIDRFRAHAAVSDEDGVRFEGFGMGLAAPTQWIDYDSTLHSFEVGVRPRVIQAVPIVLAFRTVQVHEGFRWGTEEPGLVPLLATRTNNFLYGFQVGAEPTLWGAGKPLRLEGFAKAGIYGSHARQSTFWDGLDATFVENRDRPSFVGEVGLSVAWKLHRLFTLRGGYELMWIHGLALGPEQSVAVDLAEPHSGIFTSGNALYQGAVATVEFVF